MIERTTRRAFLRAAGLSVGGAAVGDLLAACSTPTAPVIPTAQAVPSAQATQAGTTIRTTQAGAAPSATASVPPEPTVATTAERRFPEGFLWGVATSAYQIEGAAKDSALWYREVIAANGIKRSGAVPG